MIYYILIFENYSKLFVSNGFTVIQNCRNCVKVTQHIVNYRFLLITILHMYTHARTHTQYNLNYLIKIISINFSDS